MKLLNWRLTLAAALVPVMWGWGCIGSIGDTPEDSPGAETQGACSAQMPPLRRLNHTEYAHSVRDLFAAYMPPEVDVSPDARRSGFTNNIEFLGPSALLIREYYDNAAVVASAVGPAIVGSLDCNGADCFADFVRSFGRRAYRRPLTEEEVASFVAFFDEGPGRGDLPFAIEMTVQTILQSPDFIYRPEFGREGHLSPHEIASRLSYFIWQSMPDDTLLDAADAGRLSGEDLAEQVDRMLADPKAREGLLTASYEWLELERIRDEVKGEGMPWDEDIQASLRASLETFVWERGFAEGQSFQDLMTARGAFVDSSLGPIFGVEGATSELTWYPLDDRPGLLAQPAILAGQAHGTYPSPVLRGVFILNELLCDPPAPPPPEAGMDPPPETDASGNVLSNREGYEVLTAAETGCAACHDQINPFGYGLENYDAVGRWQNSDAGGPIDATGETSGFNGDETFSFDGPSELSTQLAESAQVRRCMVSKWVRYASGSGPLADDDCFIDDVEIAVADHDAGLRDLVIAIALHPKYSQAEVSQEVTP